jgi:hypothetical protein
MPVAGHLRRLAVLGEHLSEAAGIALGGRDHALLVALGLLRQASRGTARLRNDVVGVGAALVDQALAVLGRLVGVLERRLHLLGRLSLLDGDVDDGHARLVAVDDRLHQLLRILGDRSFSSYSTWSMPVRRRPRAWRSRHPGGRFPRAPDRVVVEQPGNGVGQPVLHGVLHVDDALVLSEHQRLFEHLVLHVAAVADLDLAQLLHVDQLVPSTGYGRRQVKPAVVEGT